MTNVISGISIFCEDIREEIRNVDTIVGALPDNLHVAVTPGLIPKLAIYARIILPADAKPEPINISLDNGDFEQELSSFDIDFVRDAIDGARRKHQPLTGLISKTIMSSYVVNQPTRLVVFLAVGDRKMPIGFLSIDISPSHPTASPPPS